jgi:hypothetical protein
MLSAAKRLNESGGGGGGARARHDELAIDPLDPGYYTVAETGQFACEVRDRRPRAYLPEDGGREASQRPV